MYCFGYLANLERNLFAKPTFHSQFSEKRSAAGTLPHSQQFPSTWAMPSAVRATKQGEIRITRAGGRRKLEQTNQYSRLLGHCYAGSEGLAIALLNIPSMFSDQSRQMASMYCLSGHLKY
jgi:hypothetical protein